MQLLHYLCIVKHLFDNSKQKMHGQVTIGPSSDKYMYLKAKEESEDQILKLTAKVSLHITSCQYHKRVSKAENSMS